ncbi:hypothetical protein KIPE111705_18775 [Kibdelosporangium persicum]
MTAITARFAMPLPNAQLTAEVQAGYRPSRSLMSPFT